MQIVLKTITEVLFVFTQKLAIKHAVKSEIADLAKKEGLYDEIEESWVYCVELASGF